MLMLRFAVRAKKQLSWFNTLRSFGLSKFGRLGFRVREGLDLSRGGILERFF